jgi:hypothetical protein
MTTEQAKVERLVPINSMVQCQLCGVRHRFKLVTAGTDPAVLAHRLRGRSWQASDDLKVTICYSCRDRHAEPQRDNRILPQPPSPTIQRITKLIEEDYGSFLAEARGIRDDLMALIEMAERLRLRVDRIEDKYEEV